VRPGFACGPQFIRRNMENDIDAWRDLRLPAEVCRAAEERIKGTSFRTLEDFLTFVLRDLTSRSGGQAEEQERKLVEERLRDLGYL
jgi:hypothetical protein